MTTITVDLNVLNAEAIVSLARSNVINLNSIPENVLHKIAGTKDFSLFDIVANESIVIEKQISLLRYALMNEECVSPRLPQMHVWSTIYADKHYERTNDRAEKVKELKKKWGKLLTLISVLKLEASPIVARKIREALHSDLEYINKTTKGNGKEYINFIDTGMPAFCKPQRDEVHSYNAISQRTFDTRSIAFHKATNWEHYNYNEESWFVQLTATECGVVQEEQAVNSRSLKVRKVAATEYGIKF